MCLLCGGSCAGSGDMLLISLAADVRLAIVEGTVDTGGP